jgi:hypothetical protein
MAFQKGEETDKGSIADNASMTDLAAGLNSKEYASFQTHFYTSGIRAQ